MFSRPQRLFRLPFSRAYSPLRQLKEALFSTIATFAPSSAAARAAQMPDRPAPMTTTSKSCVSEACTSGSSPSQSSPESAVCSAAGVSVFTPMACSMQLAAAFLTALVVTVAPEMLSISAFCASISASCRVGAATPPMLSVSLEVSTTTSVIAVALKVMVTFTSPMPVAVPV